MCNIISAGTGPDEPSGPAQESLPGAILRIGNTNSQLCFALPPDEFVDRWCGEGPTHHVALGVGHEARTLEKVGRLLGLETVVLA